MRNEDSILVGCMGIFFVGVFLLFVSGFFVSSIGATRGQHQGVVTAVERNTFIFSKDRAYVKTSPEATQEDQYCVKDAAVYKQLEEVSQSGKQVTIHFSNPIIEWTWNCSGESATINRVE